MKNSRISFLILVAFDMIARLQCLPVSNDYQEVDSIETRPARYGVRERKKINLKQEVALCFDLCLECFDNKSFDKSVS